MTDDVSPSKDGRGAKGLGEAAAESSSLRKAPSFAREYLSQGVRDPLKVNGSPTAGHSDASSFTAFDRIANLTSAALSLGSFVEVDHLLPKLFSIAETKIELAAAYRLKIELHLLRSESPAAVSAALECLLLFGIEISPHPSQSDLESSFVSVWHQLANDPFERLMDLPVSTDPEYEALMRTFAALYEPSVFTDERLVGVHLCKMVALTLERGITEASAHSLALFGFTIGHYFGRYEDGYRFCELARSLVKLHGFRDYEAKTLYSLELVSIWTKPLDKAIEASLEAFKAAIDCNDVPYACYACQHTITDRLARGDGLEEMAAAINDGIAFIKTTKFQMVLEVLIAQQRFVACLRFGFGATGIFSSSEFEESAFEATFDTDQAPTGVCWYWIMKAQAHLIYGNHAAAFDFIERARPLIWSSLGHIQTVDYHFIRALALAAQESISESTVREISGHSEWLTRWAESNPITFSSKNLLLLAEQARLRGDMADAERLYEEAARVARRNNLVQDEAIANEVAARFYEWRGLHKSSLLYLRAALAAYERWGAMGKAQQLLSSKHELAAQYATVSQGVSGEKSRDVDLTAVLVASQAISEEIHLDRLVERLLTLIIEIAGGSRVLLASVRQDQITIEAAATGSSRSVIINQDAQKEGSFPASLLQHVARTFECINLHDASQPNGFSADDYFIHRNVRSVLCLPLVKQGRLIAVIYVESDITTNAFNPQTTGTLQLLGTQAAISLENARLFSEIRETEQRLEEREQELSVAIDSMPALTWSSDGEGKNPWFNKRWHEYTGLTPEQARNGAWKTCFHPDDRKASLEQWHKITTRREMGEVEARLRRHDGEYRWFLVRASPLCDSTGKIIKCFGSESDIDDLKKAEALLAAETRLLEMIATGQPLDLILDALCIAIGELGREALTSILLLDEDGQTLRTGAAPNLPQSYVRAIDGIKIGPSAGSCGTAAYRGEAVYVSDIATNSLWTDHSRFPLQYGLRACWSTPIMSTAGSVLGTIAIYSRQIRDITEREREVMDRFTHLASIVIERKRAETALETSEALLAEGQRISQTGSWSWSFSTKKLRSSAEHCRLFGFCETEQDIPYRSFIRRIHREDRKEALSAIKQAVRHGQAFENDFRIFLPSGKMKFIHGSGRPVFDRSENVTGIFGAVTDITSQRLAAIDLELALERTKKSEDRQRILIDMIPCHAWIYDPIRGGEFFSQRWLDYVGLTPNDVRGDGWQKSLHPDDVDYLLRAFASATRSNSVCQLETRLRRHDGIYRWFLFTAQPLLNEKGEAVKWYGTSIDIDDLKRADKLLEAEKKLFKMIATGDPLDRILGALCQIVEDLADGALASIMLLDTDGRYLKHAASPSLPEPYARALERYPTGPNEGTCGAAVFHGVRICSPDIESDPMWVQFGDLAVAHGLLSCTSTPIFASDGSVLGAFATYSKVSGDIPAATLRIVDQFTDLASIVIERKRADDALATSEAFLAEGQKISHTGGWAWSIETDKLVWSKEHVRIFGYSIQEHGGTLQDMLARMPPEERVSFEQPFKAAVAQRQELHFEYEITPPDSEAKQLLCTGRPVLDDRDHITGYIGTTMDISRLKRIEHELQTSEAHLREAQAELAHVARATIMGEFAASIAHEVNQPLTGIVAGGGAALRWLSRNDPNVEKAIQSIKHVVQEGRRASDVIASIRQMFKKELSRREHLEINDIINDVISLTRAELQGNRIELRVFLAPEVPSFRGDRVQLQQVMMNLILNAIDAMKETGSPRVLCISADENEAGFLSVIVGDNGIGVSADFAEKMFRPFFTSKEGGLGMGLSICRSIVENHGGELRLVRDDLAGCRFEFLLPVEHEINVSNRPT